MKWKDYSYMYKSKATTCSHIDQPWFKSWRERGGDRILIKHLSLMHLGNIIVYLRRYYADRSYMWMVSNIKPWVELNLEARRRGVIQ